MHAPLRVCRDCGVEAYTEEDLELFVYDKTSKYSRQNICIKCGKEWQRKYREENHERITERQRKYREEHPEKIKEHQRKHRETNREKIAKRERKYREDHHERIKE